MNKIIDSISEKVNQAISSVKEKDVQKSLHSALQSFDDTNDRDGAIFTIHKFARDNSNVSINSKTDIIIALKDQLTKAEGITPTAINNSIGTISALFYDNDLRTVIELQKFRDSYPDNEAVHDAVNEKLETPRLFLANTRMNENATYEHS